MNLPVLAFASILTLLVGLTCSLAPVLSSGKVNLSLLLRESSTGAGSGRLGHAMRGGLVVAEIAAAVVLLFTSGLLLRSLRAAEMADTGFEPSHVLALELQLPSGRYKSNASILDFHRRLETSLRGRLGVESVGSVNCPPAARDCGDWWYSVVGKRTPARDDLPVTLVGMADSSYFQTMRIPILAGRGPSEEDRAGGPAVAVIDEVITRTWWKSPREAIGEHIKLGGPYMQGPVVEIVGVAGNVPQQGLDNPPDPQIYLPATQRVDGAMVVMIGTRGTPESIAPTVRATLASIDSDVPIQSLKPLDDWLGATLVARLGAMGIANRAHRMLDCIAVGEQSCFRYHGARPICADASVTAASMLIVLLSTALPLWRATQIDPIKTLHES